MFALRTGSMPVFSCGRLLLTAAALMAVAAGGCARTSAQYGDQSYGYAPAVAGYAQTATGEVEDDGLPVQSAPHVRIHQAPDDPSEPWSPNYGANNVGGTALTKPETSSIATYEVSRVAGASYASPRDDVYISASATTDEATEQGWEPLPGDLPPGFRRRLLSNGQY